MLYAISSLPEYFIKSNRLLPIKNKKDVRELNQFKLKGYTLFFIEEGVCCIGLCILIADHKYKVQLLHISKHLKLLVYLLISIFTMRIPFL